MKYVTQRKTLVMISIISIILMVLGLIVVYFINLFMNLDKKYISFFIYANMIVQAFVIVAYILLRANRPKDLKIVRYRFENKFKKGDMDIFPEHIFSTSPRNPTIFKIFWQVREFTKDDPPEFIIDIKGRNGEVIHDIKSHILSSKIGTEQDMLVYNGDVIIRPNEKINFKFRKDVNVKIFALEEVYTL